VPTHQLAYLSEMASVDYPFTGPVVNATLRGLFADALVNVDEAHVPAAVRSGGSLRLTEFHRDGSSLRLVLAWSNGAAFFDTNDAVTTNSSTWGDWTVWTWNTARISLRVVVSKTAWDALADPTDLTGQAESFNGCCLQVRPRQLQSLILEPVYVNENGQLLEGYPSTPVTVSGDLVLSAGFNTVLNASPEPDPGQVLAAGTSRLLLESVPGGGAGKYKDCDAETPVLRLFNGQGGDAHGNLQLDATDYYWIERAVEFDGLPPGDNPRRGKVVTGRLVFNNDAKPCSDCEDYARLYEKLRRAYERASNTHDRLVIARQQYLYSKYLLERFKAALNNSEVGFALARVGPNTLGVKVEFRTGPSKFDQFNVAITPPAGWSVAYVQYSGRKQTPYSAEQDADALLAGSAGMSWSDTADFAINSYSYWTWLVAVSPAGSSSSGGGSTVQFSATISARDVTNNTPVVRTAATMLRSIEVTG
jgi:hypothetical protein